MQGKHIKKAVPGHIHKSGIKSLDLYNLDTTFSNWKLVFLFSAFSG